MTSELFMTCVLYWTTKWPEVISGRTWLRQHMHFYSSSLYSSCFATKIMGPDKPILLIHVDQGFDPSSCEEREKKGISPLGKPQAHYCSPPNVLLSQKKIWLIDRISLPSVQPKILVYNAQREKGQGGKSRWTGLAILQFEHHHWWSFDESIFQIVLPVVHRPNNQQVKNI